MDLLDARNEVVSISVLIKFGWVLEDVELVLRKVTTAGQLV
jgi:hypothetical protein